MATMRISGEASAVTMEAKIMVTIHVLHAIHRAADLLLSEGTVYPMSNRSIPKETRYRRFRATRCYKEMPAGIQL
jgi:2-phospho-L-lactate transferase/gluconeogenesis factor (CofD/UPF0052 family)